MAVGRAVERAGARMRTKLSSAQPGTPRHEAKMMLSAVPNRRVLATLGMDRITRLGVDPDELIDAEFDDLHERWDDWTEAAGAQALSISAKQLGVDDAALDHVRERQANGRRAGWTALSAALLVSTRRVIHDLTPEATVVERGEMVAEAVAPSVVRYALAIAGGGTPTRTNGGGVKDGVGGGQIGGVATGDDIEALWGAYGQPWGGFVWVYNYDGPNPFDPHLDLDGIEYATRDDPVLAVSNDDRAAWMLDFTEFFYPGDHNGCQCDAAPLV